MKTPYEQEQEGRKAIYSGLDRMEYLVSVIDGLVDRIIFECHLAQESEVFDHKRVCGWAAQIKQIVERK
jgi:hypothetical protein